MQNRFSTKHRLWLAAASLALIPGLASAQSRGSRDYEEGALRVGDSAPAFKLKSLDGKSETDLASFRGSKPVILFFGSYT